MAGLMDLKKKARRLGMSAADARGADREELEGYISENSNGTRSKPAKKKAVAVAKSKRGRGRPKGSTNKATKAKPAKPAKVAKRGRPKGSTNSTGNGHTRSTDGRHILSSIDYGKTKGWNPREGSPPDRIVKALKKFKGNREKVFQALRDNPFEFTKRAKRDGTKRTKAEAQEMLKYRIARTDWQFAIATNQHKKATKRIEYGTGPNASTVKKSTRKRGRPAKAATAKASTKATGKKRGRGRPKGSKNKSK